MTNAEAIFIINNRLNTYYCTDEDLQALDLAIKALEERPQGEWIIKEGLVSCYTVCNKCDYYDYNHKRPNFCPNCGADMRKGGVSKIINYDIKDMYPDMRGSKNEHI